jgi:transposase
MLVSWLHKQNADHVHVCLEASSTYGDELIVYLHDQGHIVSIINPARIKGFDRSELLHTKNNKVDAGLIARFCLAMHAESRCPDQHSYLRSFTCLGTAHTTIEGSIQEHIAYLDRQIDILKQQIADRIKNDRDLKAKRNLLKSIFGVGEATIAAILAELSMFERCDRVQKINRVLLIRPAQDPSKRAQASLSR